jgi:serine/threonine-protein kinase HipA
MADLTTLDVLLHDQPIGSLTRFGGDRNLFSFNDAYIADRFRDTLSLSFKDRLGELITDIRPTQTHLMPFFANLLPEGALRDYLAAQSNVNPRRDFFLIWALGEDLPGALTIRASEGTALPVQERDTGEITERNGIEAEQTMRFSLAGVQLKFSAVQEADGGLTIPVDGVGGSRILKFPSVRFPNVPENEFAMMTLGRMVEIDVPEISTVPVADIEGLPEEMRGLGDMAFTIKRFDRQDDGTRVHIEDFAQVFGVYPEKKYKRATYRNIAEVLWAETGEKGIVEFIRRLVFNALIGNADMHLKNWSLIYHDRRSAELAPAYDLLSTIVFLPDTGMALNVARTRRFDEFNLDELAFLAAKARLPRKLVLDAARETVGRFMPIWNAEKAHLSLTAESVARIDRHIATVPLVAES